MSNKFVILECKGKQYKVSEGDFISVDLIDEEVSKNVTFENVLLHSEKNKVKSSGPKVLIMGSEEDGVDHKLLKMTDVNFKIPMTGSIASLNVSVACGIAIHKLMSK